MAGLGGGVCFGVYIAIVTASRADDHVCLLYCACNGNTDWHCDAAHTGGEQCCL